jgi:uncharacterized protein YndB with AHSA1/START domain
MQNNNATTLTVSTTVNAGLEATWDFWTGPKHITQWNNASPDWHTPKAENDLRTGGTFSYRMEAKDGSFGFDFGGTYTAVDPHKLIAYVLGDGRTVKITFKAEGNNTTVTEVFDPETVNPLELQQNGWQAILDNFKRYAEQQ